ncbi:MAG: hypothetical protein JXD23_07425 [Spirochaetales bacterium]|nr:hypothetical protein [Spirochaetales bacterium]
MKSDVSKALMEVWEWKEEIYDLVKDLPLEEQVNRIMELARETGAETRKSQLAGGKK